VKFRTGWLGSVMVTLACGSSGTSSTGVGNPRALISLLTIADDDDGSDAPLGEGGASSGGTNGQVAAGAGGNSDEAMAPLGSAQIRHATLSIAKLRFLPCDDAQPVAVVEGPLLIDLVNPRMPPAALEVPDIDGGYCGIDAPLAPASAPAALAGRSLFFDGVRRDGTLFVLYANLQGTLRLRARTGESFSAADPAESQFLWVFRPRRWLTQTEVDGAESEPYAGSRAIVIDVDRHPLLYASIRARLAGRSTLYRDLNRDGRLEPDERTHALADGLDDIE
jgi:hypothetical protein